MQSNSRMENRYQTRESKMTDANEGMAFSMTSEEENDKKGKKKEITFYKRNKTGNYVNECDEDETVKASKKGSNFLLLKYDKYKAAQMK